MRLDLYKNLVDKNAVAQYKERGSNTSQEVSMPFVPRSQLTEEQLPYGEPLPVPILIVGGRLWGDTAGKRKDNGDRSPASGIAAMLGTMRADMDRPDDDPATCLVRALLKHREDVWEWAGDNGRTYYTTIRRLDVDYHPNIDLLGISEAAGLKPSIWPWKSSVEMDDFYVRARIGYGARTLYYYPLEDSRILTAAYSIPKALLPWIVERLAAGAPFAAEMSLLDWSWQEYGRSIGVLPEPTASPR